jgi:RHS repeat-associated protein
MCPGIVVLGGGGGSGGEDGDGGGDGGDGSGAGGGNGEGAGGDGKSAPDPEKYPDCGSASHPVDVVTGRAYTHPIVDLALPGPLPFVLQRIYSSKARLVDAGFGYGWSHPFGWSIDVRHRDTRILNDKGIAVDFPKVPASGDVLGPWGWILRRDGDGFMLDADDGVQRFFAPAGLRGHQYRLVRIEDANRNRISLAYDGRRLSEVTDSAGRVIRFHGTKAGQITSVEVLNAISQGQWVCFATYTYDEHGNLASVTDADGHTARYEYDGDHRLTVDTDRTGLAFHFVYGRDGRCSESWGDYPGKRDPSLIDVLPKILADGTTKAKGIHHCKFDYMPGNLSEVADSTQVRRFFGNEHGTLDKRVEKGAVTTATYREDGHLMSRMDAMLAETTFERDARGRLLKITDALGRVTGVERDGNGLPVVITDPAGGITRFERDNRGNALFVSDAAGAMTAYRHDERGLMTEEVSPTGARRTYTYDAQLNLTAIVEANGSTWRLAYDGLGRLLSRTDPLGAETRYMYSARGDLLGVRDALGGVTRYAYDGEGHLTQVVDPKGRITSLQWGGYHKLCSRKDANGNEVRLRYNLEGELCEVYNEHGEIHRLTYDVAGNLIGETTFDGRELRYRNNPGGRVVRAENGLHQHTDHTYDLVGQLIKRELPGGSVEEFSFNVRGELTGAKSPAGELLFERDAVGRIVREAQIVGGKEHWIDVVYDAGGERIARKTSLGHEEAVTRGVLGERARTVLDGSHVVEHRVDALGRETSRGLPGGGWIQNTYDALGRVARRQAGGALPRRVAGAGEPEWIGAQADGTAVDTAYRYDWDGELIESWDRGRGKTAYAYDPIGQLLAMVPEKAQKELFRYDPAGNLYESGEAAEKREYGAGNRLKRKGATEYQWDADGRLCEKRAKDPESGEEKLWTYRWDGAGLLKAVDLPDGRIVDFAYDPFARRVQKRVTRAGNTRRDRIAVSETRFVWDGDVLVHEITTRAREGGDPVVEERTYCFEDGGFAPVAHKQDGGWFHHVNDPIGTPERLIDGDGVVACELTRKAWGETKVDGRASTEIRFQGQYKDEETGLAYNRWRYYDADDKRYVSADPLGLVAGYNDFRYPPPLANVDPAGLAPRAYNLPNISMQHDAIAHGGYHTRRAQRIAAASNVSEHGGKHTKARTCEEAQAMSQNGKPAQYYPDVDHAALERAGIANGTVTRGEPIRGVLTGTGFHTMYSPGGPIGASNGQQVSTIRAEYSSGTIHGHPRDPRDF